MFVFQVGGKPRGADRREIQVLKAGEQVAYEKGEVRARKKNLILYSGVLINWEREVPPTGSRERSPGEAQSLRYARGNSHG